MIVINGMPITDNLVDFLKHNYEPVEIDSPDLFIDTDVNSMLQLNDYLIDILTMTSLGETEEVRALSNHLINVKAARDRMKQLSALLKECREEGEKS